MRKPEWIFVTALLLVGAYFSYRYFTKTEQFNPLQLVPGSAVVLYESSDPQKIYKNLKGTDLWQALVKTKEVEAAENALNIFDSLLRENQQIHASVKKGKTLISLHVTGNENSGLMYYLPTGVGTSIVLDKVLESITGSKATRTARVYNGYTINEVEAGDLRFTYINNNGYFVFSAYGYLVEDVVRNINNNLEGGLFVEHANLYTVSKLENDAGNLYLNGKELTSLVNTVLPSLKPIHTILARSGFLDISTTKEKLFLSGFLFDDNGSNLASIFKNQEAGAPETVKLISENAAEVMIINVSDINSWYKNWIQHYGIGNNDELIRFLHGDMSLATFYNNLETNDKLFIAKIKDKEGALNVLNRKAEALASIKNDTVYLEQYADLNIGLIDENEYLESVLGSPFRGFNATYYTIYEDYLILAQSSERIKKWLSDIEEDLIWNRSVQKSSFIDESLKETTFAIVYSNPWIWSLLRESFNVNHQKFWLDNEPSIKQFGLIAFQFTNLDNRYYTEIKLEYDPHQTYIAQQELAEESLTQFAGKLIYKPKLVKNHVSGEWEVLIQDSSSSLTLLDDSGELLWTDSLGSNIVTEIYQVDLYKNRKLQYLFATDSMIHVIDRNGIPVENYPIVMDDFQIKQLFLLDYSKNRNYRFLIADYSGNIRMFDTKGQQLEGWDPLALRSELSDQIFHVRVRGKDRIVIGLANGTIEVRNRRGELENGFPIDLQYNLENPIHFRTGSTFSESRFTTLSNEGILVEFDLSGKEYARKQVDEPSQTASFSLVIDKSRNDLVLAKQDINRLTVLKKDGQQIFERDYDSASKKEVQYYYFGVDKRLYIVRDSDTGRIYLYNKSGELINAGTIFSDYPVSVVYRKKQAKCYIYAANNQSVEIKSFTF